jgi:hypothetical protein
MPGNDGSKPAAHFGRQVRKERKAKGWSIHRLAEETGISAGHLSRIENGLRSPTEFIAVTMDRAFRRHDGWFVDCYRDSRDWDPPGYRHWAGHEESASRLRVWSPCALHSLVQTEDYARGLLTAVPNVPDGTVRARLAARLERQQRVLRRENPPLTVLLVDEFSLYRLVASAGTMAAQLDQLLAVARLPHVTLQVVPGTAHGALASEIIVADSAAWAEHVLGGYVYAEPETAMRLDLLLSAVQAESYRASESVQIIERVRESWAAAPPGTALSPETAVPPETAAGPGAPSCSCPAPPAVLGLRAGGRSPPAAPSAPGSCRTRPSGSRPATGSRSWRWRRSERTRPPSRHRGR